MDQQHKFRKDLQNRKINPSGDSWDRLDKRLKTHNSGGKRKNWFFLKNAAVILVLISIGFYFFQQKKEVVFDPIVVSPTLDEEIKKQPEFIDKPKIEVAVSPKSELQKSKKAVQTTRSKTNNNSINESIAFDNSEIKLEGSKLEEDKLEANSETEISNEIVEVETFSDEQLMNIEIEQLLKNSQLKLSNNSHVSTKKRVSANALLYEVEDDLDKDLKKRIFETVVKMLKKPNEVAGTNRK